MGVFQKNGNQTYPPGKTGKKQRRKPILLS
jgi:hypothetical protein